MGELRTNRNGGYHFRRQQIIDGYIADFYCHTAALVLELDGDIHLHQRDRDEARDAVIRERGILVMRISNSQVETNFEGTLALIRQTCLERTRT